MIPQSSTTSNHQGGRDPGGSARLTTRRRASAPIRGATRQRRRLPLITSRGTSITTSPRSQRRRPSSLVNGKDFMIYTTRKNTLFSRASFSDKVHHSAVRCISWSTPQGLSFEHIDLFLARVTEKRLVELWGPRLMKCPRGWYMLSDRGFFDTARFYPNMNHQKTPKFLSGRDQFTTDELSADRRICKLRYTCEVAFSRVTKTRALRDTISNDFFQQWCSARLVNAAFDTASTEEFKLLLLFYSILLLVLTGVRTPPRQSKGETRFLF